ncbi:MAG TPA: hypothetical protein VGN16_24455 [Acidobacteriaceae bacterium]
MEMGRDSADSANIVRPAMEQQNRPAVRSTARLESDFQQIGGFGL